SRPRDLVCERLRPVPWLVDDQQARAKGGEPLVVAALALVTGTDDDHSAPVGAHAAAQRGSSTIAVLPGGTCTPSAVLLRSSACRRLGAAARTSSSAWPSTRTTLVSVSVVTVAFQEARSSRPRSPKLPPGSRCRAMSASSPRRPRWHSRVIAKAAAPRINR